MASRVHSLRSPRRYARVCPDCTAAPFYSAASSNRLIRRTRKCAVNLNEAAQTSNLRSGDSRWTCWTDFGSAAYVRAVLADHPATPCGTSPGIRGIRPRFEAAIVRSKCRSTRLIPPHTDYRIRPIVLPHPKCAVISVRTTRVASSSACRSYSRRPAIALLCCAFSLAATWGHSTLAAPLDEVG